MDWFLPSLKLIKRSAGAIAFAYRLQQFAIYLLGYACRTRVRRINRMSLTGICLDSRSIDPEDEEIKQYYCSIHREIMKFIM